MNTGPTALEAGARRPLTPSPRERSEGGRGWGEGQQHALIVAIGSAPGDGTEQREPCPVTGYACEGDLSYLCEEYGCARKGGLSPRSEENF